MLIESYVEKPISTPWASKQAEVYRGEWKKQTVYLIQSINSSCLYCFRDENGEAISYTPPTTTYVNANDYLEDILPESKNWELIFQIVNGTVTK